MYPFFYYWVSCTPLVLLRHHIQCIQNSSGMSRERYSEGTKRSSCWFWNKFSFSYLDWLQPQCNSFHCYLTHRKMDSGIFFPKALAQSVKNRIKRELNSTDWIHVLRQNQLQQILNQIDLKIILIWDRLCDDNIGLLNSCLICFPIETCWTVNFSRSATVIRISISFFFHFYHIRSFI